MAAGECPALRRPMEPSHPLATSTRERLLALGKHALRNWLVDSLLIAHIIGGAIGVP